MNWLISSSDFQSVPDRPSTSSVSALISEAMFLALGSRCLHCSCVSILLCLMWLCSLCVLCILLCVCVLVVCFGVVLVFLGLVLLLILLACV